MRLNDFLGLLSDNQRVVIRTTNGEGFPPTNAIYLRDRLVNDYVVESVDGELYRRCGVVEVTATKMK